MPILKASNVVDTVEEVAASSGSVAFDDVITEESMEFEVINIPFNTLWQKVHDEGWEGVAFCTIGSELINKAKSVSYTMLTAGVIPYAFNKLYLLDEMYAGVFVIENPSEYNMLEVLAWMKNLRGTFNCKWLSDFVKELI